MSLRRPSALSTWNPRHGDPQVQGRHKRWVQGGISWNAFMFYRISYGYPCWWLARGRRRCWRSCLACLRRPQLHPYENPPRRSIGLYVPFSPPYQQAFQHLQERLTLRGSCMTALRVKAQALFPPATGATLVPFWNLWLFHETPLVGFPVRHKFP